MAFGVPTEWLTKIREAEVGKWPLDETIKKGFLWEEANGASSHSKPLHSSPQATSALFKMYPLTYLCNTCTQKVQSSEKNIFKIG